MDHHIQVYLLPLPSAAENGILPEMDAQQMLTGMDPLAEQYLKYVFLQKTTLPSDTEAGHWGLWTACGVGCDTTGLGSELAVSNRS